jgi:hypothetical protein
MSIHFLPSPTSLVPRVFQPLASRSIYRALCAGHIYQLALAAFTGAFSYAVYRIHNRYQVRRLFDAVHIRATQAKDFKSSLSSIKKIRNRFFEGLSSDEIEKLKKTEENFNAIKSLKPDLGLQERSRILNGIQSRSYIGFSHTKISELKKQIANLNAFDKLNTDGFRTLSEADFEKNLTIVNDIHRQDQAGLNAAERQVLAEYLEENGRRQKVKEAFGCFDNATDSEQKTRWANCVKSNHFAGLTSTDRESVQAYLKEVKIKKENRAAFAQLVPEMNFKQKHAHARSIQEGEFKGLTPSEIKAVYAVLNAHTNNELIETFRNSNSFAERSELAMQMKNLEYAGLTESLSNEVKAHIKEIETYEIYLARTTLQLRKHFKGKKHLAPLTVQSIYIKLTKYEFHSLDAELKKSLETFCGKIPQDEHVLLEKLGNALNEDLKLEARFNSCIDVLLKAPLPQPLDIYDADLYALKDKLLEEAREETATKADAKSPHTQVDVYFGMLLDLEARALATSPGNKARAMLNLLHNQKDALYKLTEIVERPSRTEEQTAEAREARRNEVFKKRYIPLIKNRISSKLEKTLIPALLGETLVPNIQDALDFLDMLPDLGFDLDDAIEKAKKQVHAKRQESI